MNSQLDFYCALFDISIVKLAQHYTIHNDYPRCLSATFLTKHARAHGEEGTTIGAGIAWAWEKSRKYGLVAGARGYMGFKALRENLKWRIKEMAKIREIEIDNINYRTEVLVVPMDNYGCVIASLIYT